MNQREKLASENGMAIEFVNWFFDHKKDGCGNAWFMMMAAMWEGWSAREAQVKQLTEANQQLRDETLKSASALYDVVAENVGMDSFVEAMLAIAWQGSSADGSDIQELALKCGLIRQEVYCADEHENLVDDPGNFEDGDALYFRVETPATDAYTASLRAEGVEMFGDHLRKKGSNPIICKMIALGADEFAAQLRSKSSSKIADPVSEIQIKNGDRDLFEEWVMSQVCISKSTLEGLRTESGYRNSTLSGKDYNQMWLEWNLNSQLRSKSEVRHG